MFQWKAINMIMILLLLVFAVNTCTSFCYVPKQIRRHTISSLQVHATNKAASYSEVSNIRTQYGHDATIHYYQKLLQHNQLDTSAASFIAASSNSMRYLARIGWSYSQFNDGETDEDWKHDITKLHNLLEVNGYQHSTIRKHIFNLPTGIHKDEEEDVDQYSLERYKNDYPFGPTYVSPLVAGQGLDMTKLIDTSTSEEMLPSLQCLVTLFILSSCVPKHIVTKSLIGGSNTLELLEKLGLVFIFDDRSVRNEDWVVPLVHLFPLAIPSPRYSHKYDDNSKHIVLMTDLHPNVLGMTSIPSTCNDYHPISKEEGTVMYIGPDSLSLVQHLHSLPHIENGGENKKILDICTGSGVQALSTLAMLDMYEGDSNDSSAVALDANERALRFTSFNAILNGFEDRITTICADLLSGEASEVLLNSKETQYDILLANPPFIPTPPTRSDIPASSIRLEEKNNVSATPRYGLFSSGGSSGEDCLCTIVQLAPSLLRTGGLVAIVSEFMNPPQIDMGENATCELTSKIKGWWGLHQTDATGVLFTNEFAINSTTYSQRRAMNNDDEDVAVWKEHLTSHIIESISPGLLFIKTGESMSSTKQLTLEHKFVPKTNLGSIWTPHNYLAVEFTQKILTSGFGT